MMDSNRYIKTNLTVSISKRSTISFLVLLFLVICLFFPMDPVGLKIPVFLTICLLGSDRILSAIRNPKYGFIVLFGVIYPVLLVIHSYVLTGNLYSAVSRSYPAALLILVLVIEGYNIKYKKYVILLLKIMAIATVVLGFADFVGLYDVNGGLIRTFFYKYGMGLMGKNAIYSTYYRIYFKASSVMVLLLDNSISKEKNFWIFISLIAILLSGTRANFYVACAIFFLNYVLGIGSDERFKKNKVLISIIIIFAIIVAFPNIISIFINSMTKAGSVGSDATKMVYFKQYIVNFKDPFKLVLGSGFDSLFFNNGFSDITNSELSYFELLRSMGLIFFIPFVFFLCLPIFRKTKWNIKVSYIGYLLIAATNPLLFSSTAYVLYIFIYLLSCNEAGYLDYDMDGT